MSKSIEIKIECCCCYGTGLYQGCFEEKGYPIICKTCHGTGCEIIHYKPFTKRHRLNNVKGVVVEKYPYKSITYKEFLERKYKI
jgi:hypothetical protein